MNSLSIFIAETIFVGIVILSLHRLRKYFGIDLLLIFIGSIQFFQTLLASSIYNEIFNEIIVSPGSSILFTSSLFIILLVFHSENISKTRTIIFGLMISNIIITILSVFTSLQLQLDDNSINIEFLESILNLDIIIFMTGTCLLYIDSVLLIVIYEFLNLKLSRNFLFIKILIPLCLISLFDSVVFYGVNLFSLNNSSNLLLSSIVGKQIVVIVFAIMMYLYLKIIDNKRPKSKSENLKEIFSVFTFSDTHQTT
ncbi:hypothetical protein [Flavobacterium sp.]|uniref:hypothetical protein n=1 Tax=Flavobacterium sp. TaxID=239 RepID=UPI00374DC20D